MASLASSTPTPTSTSLLAGTVTALLALTTPFVRPPGCTPMNSLTSFDTASYGTLANGNETWITYAVSALVSDTANPSFASCQPSGWEDLIPENRFTFSPAVCPSGWLALTVATNASVVVGTATKKMSTAYCCESGYTLYGYGTYAALAGISPACVRSSGTRTVYAFTTDKPETYLVHPAWHISWEKSDTSTLSPQPPTLTNDMLIATWTPGSSVEKGRYDNGGSGPREKSGLEGLPLVIGLGVSIPLFFICLGCCCCCYSCSNKKKDKAAAAAARQQRNDALANAASLQHGGFVELQTVNGQQPRVSEEALPVYDPGPHQKENSEDPPAYVDGPQNSSCRGAVP